AVNDWLRKHQKGDAFRNTIERRYLGVSRGVFHVLDALEIAALDGVPKGVTLLVLPEPVVDGLAELWVVFAKRDGQAATGTHGDVFVNGDAGEHLPPELGQIVVHDRDRNEPGVDHFEDVVVFE